MCSREKYLVRWGLVQALYLWNVSALSLLTAPTHPQPCHCEGGRNAFQKVAPFTVKDVGCRPIFHLRLKGGDLQRERERERAELQSFLLRKMPGCVWDFSFRVNQGTKTSLTDGTVTMSYFDNVTRRALWWCETLKRQNVLLNNPRNAQSSLSQLANYHWNISFFMKLSLEGASEMLRPEWRMCFFYPRDQKKNEQITAKTHQIMNRRRLLRWILHETLLLFHLWVYGFLWVFSNAFEEKKEMLCLLIRD